MLISFLEKEGIKELFFKNFFNQIYAKAKRNNWYAYSQILKKYPDPEAISKKKIFFYFIEISHVPNFISTAFPWPWDQGWGIISGKWRESLILEGIIDEDEDEEDEEDEDYR